MLIKQAQEQVENVNLLRRMLEEENDILAT
jgi:hypothetical protein